MEDDAGADADDYLDQRYPRSPLHFVGDENKKPAHFNARAFLLTTNQLAKLQCCILRN